MLTDTLFKAKRKGTQVYQNSKICYVRGEKRSHTSENLFMVNCYLVSLVINVYVGHQGQSYQQQQSHRRSRFVFDGCSGAGIFS